MDWKTRLKRLWPFGKKAQEEKEKKPLWKEWLDALVFAGVVALIIRTFLLEAFMIPTGSMERSLMVGDFLFVSKLNYGPRMPMVPLAIPFVHNKIPFTNTKSYLDWIEFPYARIPGFEDIDRGEVVVFNFPAEDIMPNNPQLGPIYLPSMKENYIKRCVAQAGDTIKVVDAEVYINGKKTTPPPNRLLQYAVYTNGEGLSGRFLQDQFEYRPYPRAHSNPETVNSNWEVVEPGYLYVIRMTDEIVTKLRSYANVDSVVRYRGYPEDYVSTQVYPLSLNPADTSMFRWNMDFWGPAWVPKEDATIKLTPRNIALYERCITEYEEHELDVQADGTVMIDNAPASTYTFEMDYYFMMGDNRYNSQDGRVWGFVPVDHVIGKPVVVLFNSESGHGIRWDRTFSIIE